MKLITLSGGLGNQMFQYAFFLMMKHNFPHVYLSTRKIRNHPEHNGYELDRVFHIPLTASERRMMHLTRMPYLGRILSHLLFPHKYRERIYYTPSENSLIFQPRYAHARFVGYWQSEDYFSDFKSEVRQAFQFDEHLLNPRTATFAALLRRLPTSVSLHIRRGDYFANPKTALIYGSVCDTHYYEEAIRIIHERVPNARFIIFTDDATWCRQHLTYATPCTIVDWNKDEDSWQDMFLISCCTHHIVANSSFSWWGAWLDARPDKIVIAPKQWMTNQATPEACPHQWITIPPTSTHTTQESI